MNVLGIDGCRAGWCYYQIDDNRQQFSILPDLASLHDLILSADQVFIDMPVGLPDSGQQERRCDLEARSMLSRKRKSSVFRVPVREAVYAPDYATASAINFQRTGKKISKQSWYICAKIRELDTYLQCHPGLKQKISESHPELCFEGLAGKGLEYRKATREGLQERLHLLLRLEPAIDAVVAKALAEFNRRSLNPDDVLDACILAYSALHLDACKSLPACAPADSYNLPMQIRFLAGRP